MEKTDEQLVALVIDGDQDAWEKLFAKWHPKMVALAITFTHNPEEARELCQDAFLKAFKAIKVFRGEAKFNTWINVITKNVCLDWKKKKRPPVGPISEDESAGAIDLDSLYNTIEKQIANNELGRELKHVLARLPKKNREAVTLKHYGELTHQQIADLKGWPVGTVKTLVWQGLRMMRKLMQEGPG